MKTLTHNNGSSGRKALFCGGISLLTLISPVAEAQFNISQMPLNVGITADANLLYIHDDSGSMYWSFMPDGPDSSDVTRLTLGNYTRSDINRIYYNPDITYVAPPAPPGTSIPGANPPGTLGNASFNEAWYDGYDINGRGVVGSAAAEYCSRGVSNNNKVWNRVNLNSNYRPTMGRGCYSPQRVSDGYEYLTGTTPNTSAAFYYVGGTRHTITNASPEHIKQNFANWYSYYRTRNYAARAGVARAIVQLVNNIRVGWGRIYKGDAQNVDGKSVSRIVQGVRPFDDIQRKEFLNWLYKVEAVGATPLRAALDAAGQYYDRSTGSHAGPWADNPATGTGTDTAVCRKSFTILMTDGYWNDAGATGTASSNTDGATPSDQFTTPKKPDGTQETWTKLPFGDGYSGTLADVAWHYWSRDLYGGNANNKVPGNTNDPAWWQHMTTFTIGLGVAGTVDKTTAFTRARATPTTLSGTATAWPNGASNQIDDLLHAGVNGHGDFFSADNPDEFVRGMESIIADIATSAASTSGLARSKNSEKNKDKVTGDTLVYDVQNEGWFGKVSAYGVCASATAPGCTAKDKIKTTATWEASTKIVDHTVRNILSAKWNADTFAAATDTIIGTGITFKWASLDGTQQAQLKPPASMSGKPQLNDSERILDYVRGDTSRETGANAYRNRGGHKLGDIYSDPLYYGPSASQGYDRASSLIEAEQKAYTNWKESMAYLADTGTLYVGANDGMLHAFNAQTGQEKAAYVPASVIDKLWKLADPDYGHEFYADTTPNVQEAQLGNDKDWSNVLVGTAGAGGRSYFAINVTTPTVAGLTAGKVLWEFADPDLGYNPTGKASIARLKDGTWVAIFGNGYNSNDYKAFLYVVNLSNGELLKKIPAGADGSSGTPNGLSAPTVIDSVPSAVAGTDDQDGAVDTVYAGDVRGNLWSFDLSGATADWRARKLLVAEDSAGTAQPITAPPLLVRKRDTVPGIMVYVGTGKFFENSDVNDSHTQSIYGVLDTGSGDTYSRSSGLVEQTIVPGGVEFIAGADRDVATTSGNVVNYATGDRGFFLDLPISKERVLVQAMYLGRSKTSGSILVATRVPTNDACSAGTEGYWTELDALSGKKPLQGMLFAGANRVKIGIGVTPIHIGGRADTEKFGGGSGGMGGSGCIGENCTASEVICGGEIAGSLDESLKLRKACGGIGRISWRQLR